MSDAKPSRLPPSQRSDFVAFRMLQSRWMDNDIYGHMNNVVRYSLFYTAVNGWMMEQGILDPHKGESYGLVVETGCRYHTELAFPQVILAGLRVSKLGKSSVRFDIGLFGDDAMRAAADGFFVHVHVSRSDHRSVPIPHAARATFSALQRP